MTHHSTDSPNAAAAKVLRRAAEIVRQTNLKMAPAMNQAMEELDEVKMIARDAALRVYDPNNNDIELTIAALLAAAAKLESEMCE